MQKLWVSREQSNATNKQEAKGVCELQQRNIDKIYVDKRALVTFIAWVINSKTEQLKKISNSAGCQQWII